MPRSLYRLFVFALFALGASVGQPASALAAQELVDEGVVPQASTPEGAALLRQIEDLLGATSLSPRWAPVVALWSGIILLVFLAFLADLIARRILLRLITKLVEKSENEWDDVLHRRRVFNRLSRLAPAMVVYLLVPLVLGDISSLVKLLQHGALAYMLIVVILVIDSLINALLEIYQSMEVSKRIPLRWLSQVFKIALYILGTILFLSIVLDRNPGYFLGGLGAMTAVLMLIFKDSILGLVAGIQLSANQMVAVGDWIEMPQFGADGDVLEVALTTVKVRNFDKTITTIPTYSLISSSFKNWRGMSESGGRRIKRSVHIDMTSVKLCNAEMLERFSKIQFIREYIDSKNAELQDHNVSEKVDDGSVVNGRRLTNLGTFRAYVVAYLRNHPQVNQDMTLLVRQLPPTESGLPIEIYVFSADKDWVNYEAIQADIFDHLLAVVPEFDLRVFQNPTGADFGGLSAA